MSKYLIFKEEKPTRNCSDEKKTPLTFLFHTINVSNVDSIACIISMTSLNLMLDKCKEKVSRNKKRKGRNYFLG